MTESQHQIALFNWAKYQQNFKPELKCLFAIPNGGARHIVTATRLKAEGVRAGVPDIMLAVPCGVYHGLFIELKTEKGKTQANQREWLESLSNWGYKAIVCHGWEQAKDEILAYLDDE